MEMGVVTGGEIGKEGYVYIGVAEQRSQYLTVVILLYRMLVYDSAIVRSVNYCRYPLTGIIINNLK